MDVFTLSNGPDNIIRGIFMVYGKSIFACYCTKKKKLNAKHKYEYKVLKSESVFGFHKTRDFVHTLRTLHIFSSLPGKLFFFAYAFRACALRPRPALSTKRWRRRLYPKNYPCVKGQGRNTSPLPSSTLSLSRSRDQVPLKDC